MSALLTGAQVEALRDEIVRYAHRLHACGWVANHDGNLSARIGGGRLLCTPTAVSKGDVRSEWLIVVDSERNVLEGTRRAFSELQLHEAAYAARPDIGVVLHAHPPTVTGFSVSGVDLGHPFMAEPVVSLGARIPVVPYHRPGSELLSEDIGAALQQADVVVLQGHGALAVGGSFEQAFLRLELLEHLAKISLVAHQLGGIRPLPDAEVEVLSKKGRPASEPAWNGSETPVVKGNPSKGNPSKEKPSSGRGIGRPDVSELVAAALRRLE